MSPLSADPGQITADDLDTVRHVSGARVPDQRPDGGARNPQLGDDVSPNVPGRPCNQNPALLSHGIPHFAVTRPPTVATGVGTSPQRLGLEQGFKSSLVLRVATLARTAKEIALGELAHHSGVPASAPRFHELQRFISTSDNESSANHPR
jgi:hypothetical protein